jgi:hypothetical protein
MQSHPQCRVSDDMNWHNNLDGHYNGCMLFPEFMARAGEAGRDNHLQACGALSDGSSGDTTAAAPTAGQPRGTQTSTDNTQPSGGALASAAGAGASASAAANAAAKGSETPRMASAPTMTFPVKPLERTGPPNITPDCAKGPSSMPNLHGAAEGSGATLSNNVLRYIDGQTRKPMIFAVIRPAYVARQNRCNHLEGDTGLWMWIGSGGASGYLFMVSTNGGVDIVPLNAALIGQLTQ